MTVRQNAKWTVRQGRVVETDAERNYLLECPRRGVRIENASFRRPGSPPGVIDPLAQRQRCVLVPDDEPVRACGLVEQRGAKGDGARADELPRDLEQPRVG